MSELNWTFEIFTAAYESSTGGGGGWAFSIKNGVDFIVRSAYHPRANKDALLLTAMIEAIKAMKPHHYPGVGALVYITPKMFAGVEEGANPAIATLLIKLAKLRQRYHRFEFVPVGDESREEFGHVLLLAGRALNFKIHIAEASLQSRDLPLRLVLDFGKLNSDLRLPPALRLGKNGEPSIFKQ